MQTICGKQQCLHPPDQPQTLLHDKACVALSFVLNVLATTLIGYKAWSVTPPPFPPFFELYHHGAGRSTGTDVAYTVTVHIGCTGDCCADTSMPAVVASNRAC